MSKFEEGFCSVSKGVCTLEVVIYSSCVVGVESF